MSIRWITKPFKLIVTFSFGFVAWLLTLGDNVWRRATNRRERSEYDPVFGDTYQKLLTWAFAPSHSMRKRVEELNAEEPGRYELMELPIVGEVLLDTHKQTKWSDSMCNHCVHGDGFPDCPNEHAGRGFSKGSGPIVCDGFEELPEATDG